MEFCVDMVFSNIISYICITQNVTIQSNQILHVCGVLPVVHQHGCMPQSIYDITAGILYCSSLIEANNHK